MPNTSKPPKQSLMAAISGSLQSLRENPKAEASDESSSSGGVTSEQRPLPATPSDSDSASPLAATGQSTPATPSPSFLPSLTTHFSSSLSGFISDLIGLSPTASSGSKSSLARLDADKDNISSPKLTNSEPNLVHVMKDAETGKVMLQGTNGKAPSFPDAVAVLLSSTGLPPIRLVRPKIKGLGSRDVISLTAEEEMENKVHPSGAPALSSAVLTLRIANALRPHLPLLQQEAKEWSLIYSMDVHGISLTTLYANGSLYAEESRTKPCPMLLVIRDSHAGVFGGFCGEGFHVQKGFYGSEGCFLFSFVENDAGSATGDDKSVRVFKATGANDYLVLSEPHHLAFGGGEGKFGLWMDDELLNGHSESCATYANTPLSSTVDFKITGLEVWAFVV